MLQVHSLETGKVIRRFPFGIENILDISGRRSQSEIFIQVQSFLSPGIILRYDFAQPTTNLTVYREMHLNYDGFNRNDFDAKQVFYPSQDGTKIPMFIVQKKSAPINARPKPTLMHAYGGFASSIFPAFSESVLFFANSFDGILVIANIRGGGEYGSKWHEGGCLLNKQNSFDDFQAAAEYLISHNYTVARKISILGASNGGLLVGACINQRPDLFGAAIAQVSVMDMLRYQKFTVGSSWISEYGSPDDEIYLENLRKFSPLHNIRTPNSTEYQYPATLITTADHDDRVSPLHSLKFAATIQHAVQGNSHQTNPILLRVYSNAGHGGGKPISKRISEETDFITFLYRALRIETEF